MSTAMEREEIALWRPVTSAAKRLQTYCLIIYALVMHDIKNRFFGSGLGQIVMVLWPFVHIVVLMLIYHFSNRPNPYGTSLIQYTAVSIFPFICFSYVSRWIAYSAITNKAFLQYPIIKPLDLIVARALLEVVSITLVAVLLIVLVEVMGDSAFPSQPGEAAYAFLASIFFAISFGVINAVICFMIPMWNIFVTLTIICAWISSGALFVASQLPAQIRVPLSYNPLLQCIEWMRVAYFSDYPTDVLDKTYLLTVSVVCLSLGLIAERLFRRLI